MTDATAESDEGSRPRRSGGLGLQKLAAAALALVFLYGAAYAVARWRKVIVMSAYLNKVDGRLERRTQPGFDVRTSGRGRAKNEASSFAFTIFRPLCALEDLVRGTRTPIR